MTKHHASGCKELFHYLGFVVAREGSTFLSACTCLASKGTGVLNTPKVNERWRIALALLVAVLAVPLLVFNSPDSAEGVESAGEIESGEDVSSAEESAQDVEAAPAGLESAAVEFVVTREEVAPDVVGLAAEASQWAAARAEAIENGLVVEGTPLPPSDTDLSLLPNFDRFATTTTEAPDPDTDAESTTTEAPAEPEVEAGEGPTVESGEAEAGETTDPGEASAGEETEQPEAPVVEQEPASPEPELEEPAAPGPIAGPPPAPAQVNGRVPPPAGGPTAAQWDALRLCESTHNYAAISPTGLYRGAYQFSQQTWDWVAGIHLPFLVGLDPADAPPGWQDVMAYTLFAMRGWDQWPVCGTNLL